MRADFFYRIQQKCLQREGEEQLLSRRSSLAVPLWLFLKCAVGGLLLSTKSNKEDVLINLHYIARFPVLNANFCFYTAFLNNSCATEGTEPFIWICTSKGMDLDANFVPVTIGFLQILCR